MPMYGWCKKCRAVAVDGLCYEHGKVKPISAINAIDVHPLSEFEKQFLNKQLKGLQLGNGIFLTYGDRTYRRRIVALDRPLVEIKLNKNGLNVNRLARGSIKGMEIESICAANKERIDRLSRVVKTFTEWGLESNGNGDGNAIISFSGGKDSTVMAHLLDEFKLKKVFIDTTIEFSETYDFIKELQKEGWDIDTARAEKSFFKLYRENGFPKYDSRWCCKTQKFAPFAKYIDEQFGKNKVLVFSGVRRWEALSRLDQPLMKPHKHITNQITFQPLLDWLAMDTWIYTWMNNLPVNKIYSYFDRAGCWTCPFGLRYRNFVMQYSHPKLYEILQKIRNNN